MHSVPVLGICVSRVSSYVVNRSHRFGLRQCRRLGVSVNPCRMSEYCILSFGKVTSIDASAAEQLRMAVKRVSEHGCKDTRQGTCENPAASDQKQNGAKGNMSHPFLLSRQVSNL